MLNIEENIYHQDKEYLYLNFLSKSNNNIKKENTVKRNILSIIGFILMFVFLIAASNIDGKWKGTMQGPMGEANLVFNFKVIDDSLTGTVQGSMGDMEIINGKVDSTSFSFDVDMGQMKINHQRTLEGDSIVMKIPGMNGEEMEITLKKQIEKPAQLKNVKIDEN